MRYSLVTLFLVLGLGAIVSLAVRPFFHDDIGEEIKYLQSQGFGFNSFKDVDGKTYLTSIGVADRVIQDFDAIVIGKQTRMGSLELSRCQFDLKQLQEMLQPEISVLELAGVSLNPGQVKTICAKNSLIALELACGNLSQEEFTQICKMPNLCLLRLSDVTSSHRQILNRLAFRYPKVRIFCNADQYSLPDSETPLPVNPAN